MKKKMLGVLSALCVITVQANELKNFDELQSAIQHGQSVQIVTFLNECQSSKDKNSRDAFSTVTGAYKPQAFMIVNDKISSSDLHFTRNNPQYKEKSVFEFITYTFNADNTMILKSQALTAADYSPVGKVHQLMCSIGSSVKLFGQADSDSSLIKR